MNKNILLFTFLIMISARAFCMTDSELIVQRFGSNMSEWCSTKNIDYRKAALRDCHNHDGNPKKDCMVKDQLMILEGAKSGLSNKHYVIKNYLNIFQDYLIAGNITYQMYNVEERGYEEIQISNYSSGTENIAKSCTYVTCDIQISGSLNYKLKNLFAISTEGKIWKIATCEETKDNKTGKKKIHVDFSDLAYEKEETVGLTYNYSKAFPFGGSFYYAWEGVPILLSVDFGYDNKKEDYITDKVEMTDIMNYTRKKQTLDPKYYFTITPHAYFKYFAVGCGFGCLIFEGKEETATYSYTSTSEGTGHGGGNSTETDTNVYKFMIRPTIKGFIPLDDDDEWSIVVSASYNCAFGYTDKNGFDVGLGIKVNLDW